MNTISIENLLFIDNPIIIDIRYNYDYLQGHIPTAINIPYYHLERNYNHFLNKLETYYLYCEYGNKSKELCNLLNNNNYNTISIDGGYNNYKKQLIS